MKIKDDFKDWAKDPSGGNLSKDTADSYVTYLNMLFEALYDNQFIPFDDVWAILDKLYTMYNTGHFHNDRTLFNAIMIILSYATEIGSKSGRIDGEIINNGRSALRKLDVFIKL